MASSNLALGFFTILISLLPGIASAQREEILQKTQSGCSIFVDGALVRVQTQSPTSSLIVNWTGECVDGLAQGPGILRTTWKYGASANQSSTITTETMKVHRGKRFGFIKSEVESSRPELKFDCTDAKIAINKFLGTECVDTPNRVSVSKRSSWTIVWDGRGASLNGLGLRGDETLLAHEAGAMPKKALLIEPNSSMSDGVETLMLTEAPCALEAARFPECGFGEGKQNFKVYYFSQFSGADFLKAIKTFCPQPTVLASCTGIAAQLAEPYVLRTEAFVRENMPRVRETEVAMLATLADAGRQRELEARRKANAAEQSAREVAAANSAFDAKLDKAPVGELFALADEFKSKGDMGRTRAALRKLMSRFPDHKLAATAASMLTEMQGK